MEIAVVPEILNISTGILLQRALSRKRTGKGHTPRKKKP